MQVAPKLSAGMTSMQHLRTSTTVPAHGGAERIQPGVGPPRPDRKASTALAANSACCRCAASAAAACATATWPRSRGRARAPPGAARWPPPRAPPPPPACARPRPSRRWPRRARVSRSLWPRPAGAAAAAGAEAVVGAKADARGSKAHRPMNPAGLRQQQVLRMLRQQHVLRTLRQQQVLRTQRTPRPVGTCCCSNLALAALASSRSRTAFARAASTSAA